MVDGGQIQPSESTWVKEALAQNKEKLSTKMQEINRLNVQLLGAMRAEAADYHQGMKQIAAHIKSTPDTDHQKNLAGLVSVAADLEHFTRACGIFLTADKPFVAQVARTYDTVADKLAAVSYPVFEAAVSSKNAADFRQLLAMTKTEDGNSWRFEELAFPHPQIGPREEAWQRFHKVYYAGINMLIGTQAAS